MNHLPYHIYTAEIRLPENEIAKQEPIRSEVQSVFPGMKVKYYIGDLSLIRIVSDPAAGNNPGVQSLVPQIESIIDRFRDQF